MSQIMKISIYLLIALMLMGITKCWETPIPYYPDPICKSNLENTRESVHQAWQILWNEYAPGMTRRSKTSNHMHRELNNLKGGLDAMKTAQKYATANCNEINCMIRDGREGTLKALLNDLSSQMPLVESYRDDVRRQTTAMGPKHNEMVQANLLHTRSGGVEICRDTNEASYKNECIYGCYDDAYCVLWKRFQAARKDADSSWANMKIDSLMARLQRHDSPLRELAKDGCVARS